MSDRSSGFSWFLAGLGLGAAIGVLYAPKSGRETREDLLNSARDSSDYLRERGRKAASQVGEYVDRGKNRVSEYVDRGKSQWSNYVDQSRQFVHDQSEKLSAAVEAGKQAYQNVAGHENEHHEGQA